MKTFESCNRVWLTMPEDGKCPVSRDQRVRLLESSEQSGRYGYGDVHFTAAVIDWDIFVGWYPVHADGTDDHETAAKFITENTFTPRSTRPKQIRRRFKLSTDCSITRQLFLFSRCAKIFRK